MENQVLGYNWEKQVLKKKELIIERILKRPETNVRNSFLEPLDFKVYTNPSVGIPYGLPKTLGNGRCVLGTGKNSKIK